MSEGLPKVVIIGAGFGGMAAAKRLAGKPVDITLIDQRNHHLFQPLLYQVASAGLSPADIAAPIRSIFANASNVRVMLDEVTGIAPEAQRVLLGRGGWRRYDWLILATGARHSYFGRDDWAAYAPGLKSIEDALAIRRRVLLALERAETETNPAARQKLLTFVVIGGGPTGVEMAGAVAELARQTVSRDFRSITPNCSRIILVEAGERILSTFSENLSCRASEYLRELGVEIRLKVRVRDITSDLVVMDQEIIAAQTVIWAAGVQASPAAIWLGAERDAQGRILVANDLRVPGHERIFAIGDTARALDADGRALPAIAPVAKRQGRFVADRILGLGAPSFGYKSIGNLATIGRKRAVIEWANGRQQSGLFAWLIWSIAHIWFLIGFRSRVVVGLSWVWNYLTYQRSARLITGAATDKIINIEPQRGMKG